MMAYSDGDSKMRHPTEAGHPPAHFQNFVYIYEGNPAFILNGFSPAHAARHQPWRGLNMHGHFFLMIAAAERKEEFNKQNAFANLPR